MIPLLLLLIAIALAFGFGFVARWLFILAAILFAVWATGFFVGRRRWYRW
jgi:hypothetical protein